MWLWQVFPTMQSLQSRKVAGLDKWGRHDVQWISATKLEEFSNQISAWTEIGIWPTNQIRILEHWFSCDTRHMNCRNLWDLWDYQTIQLAWGTTFLHLFLEFAKKKSDSWTPKIEDPSVSAIPTVSVVSVEVSRHENYGGTSCRLAQDIINRHRKHPICFLKLRSW